MSDRSARTRLEDIQNATITVMSFLNKDDEISDLIRNICEFLKGWLACDAMGIRLKDGEDFPYYVSRGFPEDFLLLETSLCARDDTGAILRDSDGNACIECMCGNIILGRVDPSLPFFTPYGSFVSNCTTELLASTSDEDRQTRTRNRCNSMGYESVGLFPLRLGVVPFGLVQVNNHTRDFFSPDIIEFLERITDAIVIGLAHRQAKEKLEISENQLLKSEALYRTLFETTLEGIVQLDRDHVITFVNPVMTELTGYSPEEMIGNTPEIFVFPDDVPTLSSRLRERRMGRSEIYEAKMRHRNGSVAWCIISSKSLINHDGAFAGSITVFTDITRRKLSEERAEMLAKAVEQERDNLSSMLISTPVAMLVIDDQELVIFVNPAAESLFGRSIFDLNRKRFGDVIECPNRLQDPAGCGNSPECPTCPFFSAIREALVRGNPVRDKEAMIYADDNGEIHKTWVIFSVSPFVMDKRNCAIMVVYDITERRLAESQIMAALREKEVLLREIHHRVKNNLQVISSMYSLQAAHIEDEKLHEIFRESQNRIRSMSLIHDKLYQSKNLAEINVAGYIASLVGDLCVSYGVDNSRLRIEHSVADVELTLDAIIPCGLIINELVSNAIKHAFPSGREGLISIRFTRDGDACVLSVKDDGAGFPGPADRFEERASMGLQLVLILVDQLEGTITLNKDRGTEFIITFEINP